MTQEVDTQGSQSRTLAIDGNSEADIWPLLAGMRFFFAAWVLFAHTYNFGPHERAMPVFSKSGLIAVLCFFVISGYSIHHSISERPYQYRRRRFWRVWPIYILCVSWSLANYLIFGTVIDGHNVVYAMPPAWLWVAYGLLLQVFVWPSFIDVFFPAGRYQLRPCTMPSHPSLSR